MWKLIFCSFQKRASGTKEINHSKSALKLQFQYRDKSNKINDMNNYPVFYLQVLVCFWVSILILICVSVAGSRKSSLTKRVSELEEVCRVKEADRVDLELQLTQVQENLKKCLAGGVLGVPVEAKPPLKVTVATKKHTFILPGAILTDS